MNTRCPARHPGGLLGDKGGEEHGPGKPGRASAAQPSVPQPVATGATRTIDALATGVTKRPGPNLALRTEDELSRLSAGISAAGLEHHVGLRAFSLVSGELAPAHL